MFDTEYGLGIDMMRVLHGEQSFTHHAPIHAGDVLRLTTTTSDLYAKKGGALQFVVQDTRAEDAAGILRAEMRMVTVVRNG